MKPHKRRFSLAWAVGWFYYMILALEVAADTGPIAFPIQAIIGSVFSLIGLGIATLAGLLLRIFKIGKVWYRHRCIAAAFIILPVVLIIALYQFIGPNSAYMGQLFMVFGALHFPRVAVKSRVSVMLDC